MLGPSLPSAEVRRAGPLDSGTVQQEAHAAAPRPPGPIGRAPVRHDVSALSQSNAPTEGADQGPGGVPALAVGSVVARRYRLETVLGSGGFAWVYEATDQLSGDRVAVKLQPLTPGMDVRRIRRELAAMRLLRIPGVVTLLDDGVEDDRYYLVMECVDGAPFSGARGWPALAEVVVALLETVGRIHAAGVVHRDLKPANVLVTAAGRPVVLDFGLAAGPGVGRAVAVGDGVVGTPGYIAPEQILGGPLGPRADLYAVGAMLYEALAGKTPLQGKTWQETMMARAVANPEPIRALVPGMDPALAELIDRLVARDPDARPASAADALAALARDPAVRRGGTELPWLGPTDPVDRAFAELSAGRPAWVVGPVRSGRTRCIAATARRLLAQGRPVVPLRSGGRPFSSVEELIPDLVAPRAGDAEVRVTERLQGMLAQGAVIVVDDADALDPLTARVLGRLRGAILATAPLGPGATIELGRLEERDLGPLFAGPDRLLHLREDGARELALRTDGLAGSVADEVAAWVRAGLAAWQDGRLSLGRGDIERLRAGAPLVRREEATGLAHLLPALDPRHRDLLGWLGLAGPLARTDVIAAAIEEPAWRIRGDLDSLALLGLVARSPDGRVAALAVPGASAWEEDRRRHAHRRLAEVMAPGSGGRLHHLVAAGDLEAVPAEAAARGRALADEGLLGPAAAVLDEGLGTARLHDDAGGEERLLTLLCEVALALGTAQALDRALYELERAWTRSATIARLEWLMRASIGAMRTVGPASLAAAEAVRPFAEVPLEEGRMIARLRAARGCPLEEEERVLIDAATWAQRGGPRALASALMWRGLHLYRLGRFREAADTHVEALRAGPPPHLWLAISVNAASALLEAHDLQAAASMASVAAAFAARLRHPLLEGRAERVLRAARYRAGLVLEPDLSLVEGAAAVGQPDLLALMCMGEAAFALRAGSVEQAGSLAARAAGSWMPMGRLWEGALVRALADACMGANSPALRGQLVRRAAACSSPALPLQALALWAAVEPLGPVELAMTHTLAARIPPAVWEQRSDVLSPREALDLATGQARLGDLVALAR